MDDTPTFTSEEVGLITDDHFFRVKARIMGKMRRLLEQLHAAYQEELSDVKLLAPDDFDLTRCQFVKGEHLEDFPYQYLDFPKHWSRDEKFSFRTLFWWGHHVVFALFLEGPHLLQYKRNLVNRFQDVADRRISLCLSPSPWEWKRGEGLTLELTRDRKSEVGAILDRRPFFKLARFVPLDDPAVKDGELVACGREALRTLLPVITP